MSSKELISFSHVIKEYNKKRNHKIVIALPDMTIYTGELVIVEGPSGSGKSTLLHLVAGLIRPSSGTIMIQSKDMNALNSSSIREYRRIAIGIIFQQPNLIPNLSALQNVELSLLIAGFAPKEAQKAATDALIRVNLEDFLSSKVSEMSVGQQQRVGVARALAKAPAILLADEPTSALDEDNAIAVEAMLKDCHQAGTTLIVATHKKFTDIKNLHRIHLKQPSIVKMK